MVKVKGYLYAVLALLELAPRQHQSAARYERAHRLAQRLGVPTGYMSKILTQLAHAGLVRSDRGPRGGFRLARAPESITLFDVLTAIGGTVHPPEPQETSAAPAFARVRALIDDLINRTQELLRQRTLADLILQTSAVADPQ